MSSRSAPRPVATRQALVTYFADEIGPEIRYCAAGLKGAGDKRRKLKMLLWEGGLNYETDCDLHDSKGVLW